MVEVQLTDLRLPSCPCLRPSTSPPPPPLQQAVHCERDHRAVADGAEHVAVHGGGVQRGRHRQAAAAGGQALPEHRQELHEGRGGRLLCALCCAVLGWAGQVAMWCALLGRPPAAWLVACQTQLCRPPSPSSSPCIFCLRRWWPMPARWLMWWAPAWVQSCSRPCCPTCWSSWSSLRSRCQPTWVRALPALCCVCGLPGLLCGWNPSIPLLQLHQTNC